MKKHINSNEKSINMNSDDKNRYVYISQGRYGRILSTTAKFFGIDGLYTDNFTTCVILVCIGVGESKGRASLLHFDSNSLMAPDQLFEEFNCIGSLDKIIMLYKEAGAPLAEGIEKLTNENYGEKYAFHKMPISDAFEGVSIVFQENGNFSASVLPKSKKPVNIYYHCDERKCIAVRAIEQIIGKKAYQKDKYVSVKQQLIFDGIRWFILPKNELKVDESHPLTKLEMDLLRKNNNFFGLFNMVTNFAQGVIGRKLDTKEALKRFSFAIQCLEDYLNDFNLDEAQILKDNVLQLLNKLDANSASDEDNNFRNKLIEQLSAGAIEINTLFEWFAVYEKDTSKTPYKTGIIEFYKVFHEHYERRLFYKSLDDDRLKKISELETEHKYAKIELLKPNYDAAYYLFIEMLHKATAYCIPNHGIYQKILCGYGRVLLENKVYETAKTLFEFALELNQHYSDSQNLLKINNLIRLCTEGLEIQEEGSALELNGNSPRH